MGNARASLVTLSQAAIVVATGVDMVWPSHTAVGLLALVSLVFVLLAPRSGAPGIRRTAWVLAFLALALLPAVEAPWARLEQGVRIGGLISSILLSVSLLSRAAQRVVLLRRMVTSLLDVPRARRGLPLVVATQLFGGFLGFAGIAMLMESASQLAYEDGDDRLDCFKGISRGFAAANLWSPMYSNVSILLALSPGLAWGRVFPLALLLGVAVLGLTLLLDRVAHGPAGARPAGAAGLFGPLRAGWPVFAFMFLFLLLAVGASGIGHLPVAALILVMAPAGALLLALFMEPQRQRPSQALHRLVSDFRGFHVMAGEIRLLMASGCAGTVVAAAIPAAWTAPVATFLQPYPVLACIFLPLTVVLLSCTSVHPMLSGIVVASAFPAASLGLSPTTQVLAVLGGLGLAVTTTPFSVVSLTASRLSGLPLMAVSLRANLGFTALSLLLLGVVLGGANLLPVA